MPGVLGIESAMRVGRAVAVVGLLAALVGCSGASNTAPPPPEVMVAQVLQQKLIDWDEYTGRFQAIDTVEVRPRVSGYIDRVLFSEGKAVKKGETLIVIDPRPYQADYDRAKAELALAKAQRELARGRARQGSRKLELKAERRLTKEPVRPVDRNRHDKFC